ncbi:hypothetical protein FHETE_4963 [Fusarium heterosporum]|uniref:Zn(2)-C6 fungal-type domain-containing protein n=1 Tax=Fusarium heterosporum TaxID=42747 RepID=A0A8H5TC33_FUSHE|nr:hypothetical protein FHETE_4963 [Fusarium heterosporum]
MSMPNERPCFALRVAKTRQRKGPSKTRTGCKTCRIRKVKCDEGRPSCQRCVGTGRKCDGYDNPGSLTQQNLTVAQHPPVTRALNTDLGAELSVDAFEYYRDYVSLRICDVIDRGFWRDLVLRLAPTDPAIRHAISAISIMYADKTNHRGVFPNYRSGIMEYNKAILAVRSWPHATENRVKPLLVCLLFICIEFMLGHEHHNVAQMHILQGRRLLEPIKDQISPEIDVIRQYLAPIYLRLAFIGNERVDFPRHLSRVSYIPPKFKTMTDARNVLYFILDEGYRLVYDVKSYRSKDFQDANQQTTKAGEQNLDDALHARYRDTSKRLVNWRHAFDAFLAFSNLDQEELRTANLLTLRHSLGVVFLDSMFLGSDYVCDRNSIYEIATATDAAAFVVDYDDKTLQNPSFTFESEVVGTVYWIAANCRQPAIRRRAIDLLHQRKKAKRVESLTMIDHTIAMTTRVMQIEEEGLPIPQEVQPEGDHPTKFRVVTMHEVDVRAERFHVAQKEQWPVLWNLGNHSSEIPTRRAGITAARERKEVEEGLAKGWPRERLIWPYEITRERRVLSVIVKRHTATELWLEYVREPLTVGGDYRIMKEHIEFI